MSTSAVEGLQPDAGLFRYLDFTTDAEHSRLVCRYDANGRTFVETITFPPSAHWESAGAQAAARLVFLLAGISYYKTTAPPVIDLGDTAISELERAFLRQFYLDGLGEFAVVNQLDLGGLRIDAPTVESSSAGYAPVPHRPLIPFGGGVDSIVTVESLRDRFPDAALFIVSRPGDRFAAIERSVGLTGLPVVRVEREIDEALLRSRQLGFRNGHVPVTGILSAIGVLAAVLDQRDAVVMSNEWSSSVPTLETARGPVNHQYSKSLSFETGFREVVAASLGVGLDYFSALRPYSGLWIAERFATLTAYHGTFCSCNRAFHIDPAARYSTWCGHCDKCAYVDLALSPFMSAAALDAVFGGHEPLADEGQLVTLQRLLALAPDSKPFECVGDATECRTAVSLASARPDRAGSVVLQRLAEDIATTGAPIVSWAQLREPRGPHFIPEKYGIASLVG